MSRMKLTVNSAGKIWELSQETIRGEGLRRPAATHRRCNNPPTRPRHARQRVKRYAELQGDLQKSR
ncbi:MAG: hypothetical protein IJQ82_13420 [Selenomonadaceae bacterium]|nr:hypothetical protein [Selenomonadaceae bacterium]